MNALVKVMNYDLLKTYFVVYIQIIRFPTKKSSCYIVHVTIDIYFNYYMNFA